MYEEQIEGFVSKYDEMLHNLIMAFSGLAWGWVCGNTYKYMNQEYTLVVHIQDDSQELEVWSSGKLLAVRKARSIAKISNIAGDIIRNSETI